MGILPVLKLFFLLCAVRVLPLSAGAEGVCAGSNCPAFVCPTVRDEVAGDEIQLELQQIERPPIKSLEEYGIPSSLTHWQCVRPREAVRLSSNGKGRVEIYYFKEWGTVCNTSWNSNAAQVVCKELGHAKAVAWPGASAYEEGTGRIWLDNTVCSGTEESLYRCRKSPIGANSCGHDQDAGVVCDLKGRLLVAERTGTNSSFFISEVSKSSFEPFGWKPGKVYSVSYDSMRGLLYALAYVGESTNNRCRIFRRELGIDQWITFAVFPICNGYNSLVVDETDGYVYWTAKSGEFYRRDPDKESGKSLLYYYSSNKYPRSLVIRQSQRTYYILRQTGIITGDFPRQSETVLHAFAEPDSRSNVRGLALDEVGGTLFFSVGAGMLKKINIEGTSQEVDIPIALDVTPFSMFFESGWLVWVEPNLRRVARWAPRAGFGNITYHPLENVSDNPGVVALIPDN